MALTVPIREGVALTATTNTTLYTATSGKAGSAFITIANRTSSAINVRTANRALGAAIADGHYVLYDFPIPGNDRLVVGPLTTKGTDILMGWASATGITMHVDGWEEA